MSLDSFHLQLSEAFKTLNWEPNPQQLEQFTQLYGQVLAGNERLNLTRITEPDDFIEKHLWDSLSAIFLSPRLRDSSPGHVIDLGTGAGFPGLPIAIAYPDWPVTVLDSTRKKIQFIIDSLSSLGLTQVMPLVGRTEALGRSLHHREKYDLALARALADSVVCAEYALPFLKIGGWAVLYRGQWSSAEEEKLSQVAPQLGGILREVIPCRTPWTNGDRHLVYLEKISPTAPLYPRSVGIPRQSPLT